MSSWSFIFHISFSTFSLVRLIIWPCLGYHTGFIIISLKKPTAFSSIAITVSIWGGNVVVLTQTLLVLKKKSCALVDVHMLYQPGVVCCLIITGIIQSFIFYPLRFKLSASHLNPWVVDYLLKTIQKNYQSCNSISHLDTTTFTKSYCSNQHRLSHPAPQILISLF